jgi:RNA polymerase sigma-70 factor (ECF subfamily)
MPLPRPLEDLRLGRLVRRAQRGDPRALRELYRGLHPAVHRFVARRVRHRADAEDLVARVFTQLLEALPRIDPGKGSVRLYALTAARRAIIDHARARHPALPLETIEALIADPGPDPLSRLAADEDAERVRTALAALPAEKRELIALRYADGLRSGEIAGLLGLSEEAVRQRLSRALRELRESCLEGLATEEVLP